MPPSSDKRLAVITGASEGIGRDLAACYAREGFDLVLVARRESLLQDLAAELRKAHGTASTVVVADLSKPDECDQLAREVEPMKRQLFALVNNAGLGTHGWFHELPIDRQRALIDVNISALTHLSRAILPWLRANGRGHIMNVASVASFQPGPLMATYYASKAYVLSLSEALHNESRGSGVTVTAVCPGPTKTGFARSAGISPGAPAGGAPAMTSAEVAELAFRGTMAGKPVVVTGFRNKVAVFIGRYLPRAFTAEVVRKIQMARLKAGMGDG
ncbi:MAG: SDR family NAD(P)-dependent oxidoreductase [Gemmatimonadaceae bacterium]